MKDFSYHTAKRKAFILLTLLLMFSCKDEEIYPPFDSSVKLLEIDHEYNYIADVYTFNYNSEGRLAEMYGRGLLLSQFYYENDLLIKIETSFEEMDPEETYLFNYENGKVLSILYTHTQETDSIQYKYLYEYDTPNSDFTRYDSIYFPSRELSQISRFTLNQVVHEVYVGGELNNTYSEKISYSKYPNFFSCFRLPILPDPIVFRAFGFSVAPEILEEAGYLPKDVNGLEYYDYEYDEGLIRKIFIYSPSTSQPEIVTLIWER